MSNMFLSYSGKQSKDDPSSLIFGNYKNSKSKDWNKYCKFTVKYCLFSSKKSKFEPKGLGLILFANCSISFSFKMYAEETSGSSFLT